MEVKAIKFSHCSLRVGSGLAVVALLGGCGTEPSRLPAAIAVAPELARLLWFDETVELTATLLDRDGEAMPNAGIAWTSGDESVVTVDAAGLVTAVGKGEASVRAEAEGVEGSAIVTVDLHRGALLRIHDSLGGPRWKNREGWGTDAPLDTWFGVTTNSKGDVVELSLSSNELVGRIPPEIGVLEPLEDLDLSRNDLAGPIPPELLSLTNLRGLSMSFRAKVTTGVRLPPELGNLTSLRRLSIVRGVLIGPIPSELGNLMELRELDLSFNHRLTGPIPPELGDMSNLQYLTLSGTELTGPVPPEFGNLEVLRSLRIDNTALSGRLPRGLMGIIRLQQFYWYETGLCSPRDEEFQEWLASIRGRRGNGKCAS